jgi:Glycosyl hydrolases family 38 N-terminal domain
MCPSETYTAQANVGDLIRSVTQHKNLNEDTTSLLVFGNGDGGGGPLAQMLEKLRRCRGVSDTIGRLPKLKMGYYRRKRILTLVVLSMNSLRSWRRILTMVKNWSVGMVNWYDLFFPS